MTPLHVGSRLGHYDVTALIGEGGMGQVYRAVAAILVLLSLSTDARAVQDDWETADRATQRLAPSEVRGLPEAIRQYLEALGCMIPVPAWSDGFTNVVRGEYRRPGQDDWAVLCSIDRVSRILVFWNGEVSEVPVLAEAPDRQYLQRDESGRLLFSRAIGSVGPNGIRQRWPAGHLPAGVHAGIEDHFLGKASMIHYQFDGRWVTLQGAE
jgi:hypothetical protein